MDNELKKEFGEWDSASDIDMAKLMASIEDDNNMEFVMQLQATADRLRGLLKEMPEFVWDDEQEAYFCPICGANSNHGHLGSCRLAKELDDTALGS